MPTRAQRRCLRPGCPTLVGNGYCDQHALTHVTLVAGPPMAGKTTYVRQRAQPGDLILDWDELGAAISGLPAHQLPQHLMPYVAEARDAILTRLEQRRGGSEPPRAWIIHTAPTREERDDYQRRHNADVVVLGTPADECIGRLLETPDGRNQMQTADAIRTWWTRFTP